MRRLRRTLADESGRLLEIPVAIAFLSITAAVVAPQYSKRGWRGAAVALLIMLAIPAGLMLVFLLIDLLGRLIDRLKGRGPRS